MYVYIYIIYITIRISMKDASGSQVLQQMPDPQKSVEMAFQMSFGSRNWSDVLEYVLDTNAYLEKQFLQIFHQQLVGGFPGT